MHAHASPRAVQGATETVNRGGGASPAPGKAPPPQLFNYVYRALARFTTIAFATSISRDRVSSSPSA